MKATTYTVPRLLIYAYNCVCAFAQAHTAFIGQFFFFFFFDLIVTLSPVIDNFTKIKNSMLNHFHVHFDLEQTSPLGGHVQRILANPITHNPWGHDLGSMTRANFPGKEIRR